MEDIDLPTHRPSTHGTSFNLRQVTAALLATTAAAMLIGASQTGAASFGTSDGGSSIRSAVTNITNGANTSSEAAMACVD